MAGVHLPEADLILLMVNDCVEVPTGHKGVHVDFGVGAAAVLETVQDRREVFSVRQPNGFCHDEILGGVGVCGEGRKREFFEEFVSLRVKVIVELVDAKPDDFSTHGDVFVDFGEAHGSVSGRMQRGNQQPVVLAGV